MNMMELSANHTFYTWDPRMSPQIRIQSGDTVRVETVDCYSETLPPTSGGSAVGEVDVRLLNPLTGPIWVEGAVPGDTVAVEIQKLEFKPYAVVANRHSCGILGDRFRQTTYKNVPIADGKVQFDQRLSIPLRPMVGVIGVAPETPISTRKSGCWGGNLDNNKITEGAVVYLPVQAEGALLAVGDLHAVMGDGEINGSALEAGGYVTMRITLLKDLKIRRPVVLDEEFFYTVATEKTALEGIRSTCEDMLGFLAERTALAEDEITMLLSVVGDCQACVACSQESQTFRLAMPRYVLEAYGFTWPLDR